MATTTDIVNQIKSDLLINGSDYDAQILSAIQSTLREYRGKRFWFLMTTDTLTTTQGSFVVDLPDNYSAPESFDLLYGGSYMTDGFGFDYLTYDRLKRDYWLANPLTTTVPQACAVLNNTLYLSCLSNGTYTINITYYMQDETLPVAGETSVWFDDGYDAIRTRAQYIFKRDAYGFTATEEDGSMAREALAMLGITHENREAGR